METLWTEGVKFIVFFVFIVVVVIAADVVAVVYHIVNSTQL